MMGINTPLGFGSFDVVLDLSFLQEHAQTSYKYKK